MSFELAGIGTSGGIAIGTALVLEPTTLDIPEHLLLPEAIEPEVLRLRAALSSARDELLAVRDAIPGDAPQDTRLFIDAHLLMLDDPALRERPLRSIRDEHRNAAWAIQLERERLLEIFDRMEDPYLRAKREDIIQVTNRVLRYLIVCRVRWITWIFLEFGCRVCACRFLRCAIWRCWWKRQHAAST